MSHKIEENSYIMTRPVDSSQTISVEKAISFQEKKDMTELYEKSFNQYILNSESLLNKKTHKRCVNSIFPSLAVFLFHEQPEITDTLRDIFVRNASPDKIKIFEAFPDQETGFCYVLNEFLAEFVLYSKRSGRAAAEESYKPFYEAIKLVYFNLPAAHVFNLIDVADYSQSLSK